MFTISLCMIVRDEEESLGRCLSTVYDLVDEIIIVDTGSTDRTKEIALTYGAQLFDFTWVDDFSAARNFAFAQAKMTYIFWLDADDVLLEVDRERFAALKTMDNFDYDSVSMPYHLKVDERGKPVHYLRRNRLVRRKCNFVWHGAVHEYLAVAGEILHSEIAITHQKNKPYTDRNLQIYVKRKENGEVFDPRDQFYFANELFDHARYEEAAEQYQLFLDGGLGWIEDQIWACQKQSECYAHLKQPEKQIQSLSRTLAIDLPRAEICCRMGAFFAEKQDFPKAIYWYRQATLLERPQGSMGKVDESAWTWLPHIQLCYCYDRLGDQRKAKIHHDMAKLYYPTHPSVAYNEAYFARLEELDSVEQ
ncbi:glycosyltransferase involved in cell wall biosynthesis [Brevibacillus sp. AG162]|uniref:glycosyltransferase family 2 protein n=1 Tax=Brevibacillus sp. AG162 TaxID=2572910 RepID=UPI0011511E75|nr:glycosyltransferase family 2 protein [Brevibacillus sp. AG162]TQK53827.1 glycosyltransferase involved in cell wall biosynthesis [Brevibacillus sp. AG162]